MQQKYIYTCVYIYIFNKYLHITSSYELVLSVLFSTAFYFLNLESNTFLFCDKIMCSVRS